MLEVLCFLYQFLKRSLFLKSLRSSFLLYIRGLPYCVLFHQSLYGCRLDLRHPYNLVTRSCFSHRWELYNFEMDYAKDTMNNGFLFPYLIWSHNSSITLVLSLDGSPFY